MGDIDQIIELVVMRYLYNFDWSYVNYYDMKEIIQSSEICWNYFEINYLIWL